MKLFVIRHAAAIERSGEIAEEQRYLTPEGRDFMRKTARTMLKKGVEPCVILTSPLARAIQTADILAEAVSSDAPVVVTNELAPGFNLEALQRLVNTYQQVKELVIVGHEPDMSGIVTALLSLEREFIFKKGSAFKLSLDGEFTAPATFKWLAAGKKLISSLDEAVI